MLLTDMQMSGKVYLTQFILNKYEIYEIKRSQIPEN